MKPSVRQLLAFLIVLFACLSMAQAYTLSGTVYGGGTPLLAATVTLTDAATGSQVGQVTTAADGKYAFSVASASYKLQVAPPPNSALGAATIASLTVAAADVQQDILLIGSSLQLSGTLTGAGGGALSGLTVNLFASSDMGNTQQLATAQTDAAGHYSFAVSPGSYMLQLIRQSDASSAEPAGGWVAYHVGHATVAGDTVNDVALPFVQLDGQTTDAGGVAIGAVSVATAGVKWGLGDLNGYVYMFTNTSVSDAQGHYRLVVYSGFDQSITLTPPAGSALALTTLVVNLNASETRNLAVSPAYSLGGTLTGAGGGALSGLTVNLFASSDMGNTQQLATAQTDAAGHYSFAVSPGSYMLQLIRQSDASSAEPAGGWVAYHVGHATVAGDTVNDVALPFVQLDGQTTDAGGVAIGAVSVATAGVKWGLGDLNGYVYMFTNTSVSDAQGHYRLVVYSGFDQSITLTPPAGSALALTTLVVNLNASETRNLAVSPAYSLGGTLTGAGGGALSGLTVNLFASSDMGNTQQLATAQTDAAGHYSFAVSPGSYMLQLIRQSDASSAEPAGGWVAYHVGHATVAGDTVNDVALPFVQLGGQTMDSNGVAVGAVSVSTGGVKWGLGDLNGYVYLFNTTSVSDAQGRFSLVVFSGGADITVTPPTAAGFGTTTQTGLQVANANQLNIVLTFHDTSAPTLLSGPTLRLISATSAVVEWQTDEPATGSVKVGSVVVPVTELATTHSVQVSGLSAATAYRAEVSATDAAGNGPTVKGANFSTVASADVFAPFVLEGPTVTHSTDSSMVVEWTTNEPAKGSVSYGIGNLGGSSAESVYSVKHRVELTGLTSDVAYNVRIGATDAAGNGPTLSRTSTGRTLPTPDTTPPVITNGPLVSDITDAAATVAWKTDEPSTGGVSWNDGVAYGVLSDDRLSTEHSARITGLGAAKTYHLTVSSKDALGNGPTLSKTVDFATQAAADHTAPVIVGGPSVLSITQQSAVVQWDTDEPADTQILYGQSSAATLDKSDSRAPLTKKHSLPLVGLSAGTSYRLQVRSQDASGNASDYSSAISFTTSANADTALPVFDSPPAVGYATDKKAVIQWSTDKLTDSQVTVTPVAFDEPPRINAEGTLKDLHELSMTGLTPNKAYSVSVTSTDLSGNTVTTLLGEFTTPPTPDSQLPLITAGPTVQASATTAVVTWSTDKLADSKASYGPAGATLSQVTGDIAYAKQHRVVLSKLQPASAYQVQVASIDPSGNGPALSGLVGFSTPADAGITTASMDLAQGWNLLGNGYETTFDVATVFGDASQFSTVWKWVNGGWAFYAPSLSAQALADYTASKGYSVLARIQPGEGFWVNTKQLQRVNVPSAATVVSSSFNAGGTRPLSQGWSLIATGDQPTPAGFNRSLSLTPPAPGTTPLNVVSLWAWDTTSPGWYFWAPSMDNSGALATYITTKVYLDFTAKGKTLDASTGFWVNKP